MVEGDSLSSVAQQHADKYLIVERGENGLATKVSYNALACSEKEKYLGFFALISDDLDDAFASLREYRQRNHVETFFRSNENVMDGKKLRVWSDAHMRGRMLVNFIALCYCEYYSEAVRKIISGLGVPNGEKEHDTGKVLDKEKRLKCWLEDTSVKEQLQWFDVVENVSDSTPVMKERWTAEMTERDRLFLDKLGVRQAEYVGGKSMRQPPSILGEEAAAFCAREPVACPAQSSAGSRYFHTRSSWACMSMRSEVMAMTASLSGSTMMYCPLAPSARYAPWRHLHIW